jgi:hypothetical protein
MQPNYVFSKRQIMFFVTSGNRLEVLDRLRPIIRYSLVALNNLGPVVENKSGEFGTIAGTLARALHTLRDPSGAEEFYAWFRTLPEASS